jgi:hypothetical protein
VHFCLPFYYKFVPCYYLALPFYSYTCWVPTISVLNLASFLCYSNLLLRRRRWTRILRWGVLGYVSPQLLFLWSYGVFRYSISLRVIVVFRDIIYVINILYSWHLVICGHFLSVCVEQLILGIHTMSTCFCLQNWVWQPTTLEHSWVEIGKHLYGLHCGSLSHLAWVRLYMGNCGSFDEISSLHTRWHQV